MKFQQYVGLGHRILEKGVWVENERTGKRCLTVINADLTYEVGEGHFPIVTTRKSFWKSAVAELLGYIRGYDNAADFRKLGTKTWDANANKTPAWLANPNRAGEDDMGLVYGAVGNAWPIMYIHAPGCSLEYSEGGHGSIDTLDELYQNLKKGIDSRGEIWSFWNPGMFHLGALRPCVYSHHFSLLGGKLYLNSTQRSCDVPLGLNFNMVQVYVFLQLMAQITGHEAGEAYHKIVNAHIYEDQIDDFMVEMKREEYDAPQFKINPKIKTLEDLRTWVTVDDFELVGYDGNHGEPIKYPMSE